MARFQWHSDQITSLEWDPHDESVIAASGADGQVTVWDLSVEKDTEQQVKEEEHIPPQLMFSHMVRNALCIFALSKCLAY